MSKLGVQAGKRTRNPWNSMPSALPLKLLGRCPAGNLSLTYFSKTVTAAYGDFVYMNAQSCGVTGDTNKPIIGESFNYN